MQHKKSSSTLEIFFIVNISISLIFFLFSIYGLFTQRGTENVTNPISLLVWLLMGFPFYVSLIPLLTFIFRKRLNNILVGIITAIWLVLLVFIALLIFLVYQSSTNPNATDEFLESTRDLKGSFLARLIKLSGFIFTIYIMFYLFTYNKKEQQKSKQKTNKHIWLFGLIEILLGLFVIFLGILLAVHKPFTFGKFFGGISLAIIGLFMAYGGYTMTKMAEGKCDVLLALKGEASSAAYAA